MEPTQFLLFAVLIAPGFVARSVYRLLIPFPRQDATGLTVELATYGMINLGLVAWMIPFVLDQGLMDERPVIFALSTTAMLVIVPASLWRLLRAGFIRLFSPPGPGRLLGECLASG